MKKINILLGCIVLGLFLNGCSIKQEIKSVTELDKNGVICIVQNPPVRAGFLQAMQSELINKGYKIKIIPAISNIDSCPTVSTYYGKWSWDLAIYLSYANIKVYKNGKLEGEALYDSTKGGGNMSKFVNGENKIRELVNLLFP